MHSDPIAIIGMGCRLPGGASNPVSLWQLLYQGVDAIRPVPEDRWDADRFYSPKAQQPGRRSAREAGFLDSIDGFDAAFFGISGRVAEQMDPQQPLLLEVSLEALEDAEVVPERLAGGDTGVFVGACSISGGRGARLSTVTSPTGRFRGTAPMGQPTGKRTRRIRRLHATVSHEPTNREVNRALCRWSSSRPVVVLQPADRLIRVKCRPQRCGRRSRTPGVRCPG